MAQKAFSPPGRGCCGKMVEKKGFFPWESPPGYEDALAKGVNPPSYPGFSGLWMRNSLTDDKEPFIPQEGRQVKAYVCGPTVYDACHMGHARAYLTFDILRRIMEDYFGYEFFYQINVTDIDDKIILRARRNKLVDDYVKKGLDVTTLDKDVQEKLASKGKKLDKELADLNAGVAKDAKEKNKGREAEEREKLAKEQVLKVKQFQETMTKYNSAKAAKDVQGMFAAARDILAEVLDERLGETVRDNMVFEAHARKFEESWMVDMDALGVRPPDLITRVTEYVPEIVAFIKKVIEVDGFAYEANGSVYFDTVKFKQSHNYPKLNPKAGTGATDAEIAEGEGALASQAAGEKRHKNDFALWKKSKRGEPSWESPWGMGRPGWHIECSVMASDVLGARLDIHGGGSDLKFPHHDNEMAQSEAFHGCQQWVNYWMHAGRLDIEGLKMSKSLKNFITIQQALERDTPRQLRLMFLMQKWDKPMEYSDQTMDAAKGMEKRLTAFFGSVKNHLRRTWQKDEQKWENGDKALNDAVLEAQTKVHAALCDNFDTSTSLNILSDLITETNKYLSAHEKAGTPARVLLLKRASHLVSRILRIFGLIEGHDGIGFGEGSTGADGVSKEETVAPFLDAFAQFRDEVRKTAMEHKVQPLLKACDVARDETMVELGIRLEDKPGQPAIWKLEDKETLRREQAAKAEKELDDKLRKLENKLREKKKEVEKWQTARVTPAEYFDAGGNKGRYTAERDENNLPVKTAAEGEELSKKAKKNVEAELKKHTKLHEELVAKAGGNIENFVAGVTAEVKQVESDVAALKARMN